jgi:rhamnosyltransferase
MSVPKVAVLLAAFNGEKFIASQLASVFGQVGVDIHVIARDDGSSDGTVYELRSFQKAMPGRLTILDDDKHNGGSAGRNFLAILQQLSEHDYDYFALCDQDDIWNPVKIVNAIHCMRSSNSAAYSSNLIAFDDRKQRTWFIHKSHPRRQFDYLFQSASAGCTYVLDRRAFAIVQSVLKKNTLTLPRILSHDYLIYALCRSHGLRWVMDDASYIFYRQHDSNAFSAMPGMSGLWQRWHLARGGWFKQNIMFVTKLLPDDMMASAISDRLENLTLTNRLWLATRCHQFRRRRRDQILLAITILLGRL